MERLKIALEERNAQVAAFLELNRSLSTELKREWKKKVLEWQTDPENHPCPYSASSTAGKSFILTFVVVLLTFSL